MVRRSFGVIAFFVLVVSACSSSSGSSSSATSGPGAGGAGDGNGDGDGSGDGTTPDGPPTPSCEVTGFGASATPFTLPNVATVASGYTPFNTFGGTGHASQSDSFSFAVADVDGDYISDLIVTSSSSDAALGSTHWDVYKGSATGFAPSATPFTLPTVAPVDSGYTPFNALGGSGHASKDVLLDFSVIDIDGDHVPDLVITGLSADASLGNTHWNVYKGSATGFAPSATPFTLPTVAPVASGYTPFIALGGSGHASQDVLFDFVVTDVDGDRRPDLVVTGMNNDPSLGNSHWNVYRGSATGFAPSATSFTLPTVAPVASGYTPFGALGGSGHANQDTVVNFAVDDVDGDHLPDLVVTALASDPSLGSAHWNVYKGSATGFAPSATSFALPTVAPVASGYTPFGNFGGTGHASQDVPISSVISDVDGDHVPDLVITSLSSDVSIGTSHWSVYKGSATGFAASATPFTLPTVASVASGYTPFNTFGGSGHASQSDSFYFVVADVTGDGAVDLVLTSESGDPTIGASHWNVYSGACK